jgi:predicted esterase
LEPPVVGLMENCRIVVPRPPNRETTIYGGRSCISWFDVKDRGENSFINPLKETVCVDHIFESEKLIEAVINEELKLVDENHLILGGFSQGCAMSLHMAFTMKKNWAGV